MTSMAKRRRPWCFSAERSVVRHCEVKIGLPSGDINLPSNSWGCYRRMRSIARTPSSLGRCAANTRVYEQPSSKRLLEKLRRGIGNGFLNWEKVLVPLDAQLLRPYHYAPTSS